MTGVVASLDQAHENIRRYQADVRKRPELAKLMRMVHAWYAIRSNDGSWLFGPSKFVGYAGNDAETYLSALGRHGGESEAALKPWFAVARTGTPLRNELDDALSRFLQSLGHHAGPRKDARICVPKALRPNGGDALAGNVRDRIGVDPEICGGRPHVRGTRVRVADILEMLAHGVSSSEILADYPYLGEEDVRAALAFGAVASEHRIIPIA